MLQYMIDFIILHSLISFYEIIILEESSKYRDMTALLILAFILPNYYDLLIEQPKSLIDKGSIAIWYRVKCCYLFYFYYFIQILTLYKRFRCRIFLVVFPITFLVSSCMQLVHNNTFPYKVLTL